MLSSYKRNHFLVLFIHICDLTLSQTWAHWRHFNKSPNFFIDLLCRFMVYRSTSETVLAFHRSYFCLWLDMSNHRQGNLGGLSNNRFENRGLRCILSNDRYKNEQRNRHCRMITDKNDDGCPALSISSKFPNIRENFYPIFTFFTVRTSLYVIFHRKPSTPVLRIAGPKLQRKLFFLRSYQHS